MEKLTNEDALIKLTSIYQNLLGRDPDESAIKSYLHIIRDYPKKGYYIVENSVQASLEYKKINSNIPVSYYNQSNRYLKNKYKEHFPLDSDTISDKNYADTIKIVIYSPPVNDKCGGIMVLHHLCETINNLQYKNIKSYIYYYDHLKHTNNFCNNFFNPFLVDNNTIVIYPEIIVGNPLNAKHVIRWILLDIGIETQMNTVKSWQKSDIVYHWEPSKLNYSKQFVNIWHNPIVKPYSSQYNRKYNCYAYKKILHLPDGRLHKNSIKPYHKINDISVDNKNMIETMKIFYQSNIFYCYDPNSFLAILAPLCGCLSIIYPASGVSKENFYKARMIHKNGFYLDSGIAYGDDPEEVERAKDSLPNIYKDFEYLKNLYKNDVKNFIEDLQQLIKNPSSLTNTVKNIYQI